VTKYVEILFRFKFRFALLLIVLPAAVAVATIILFPSYKASAELWVDDPGYFGGATPSGWSQYLTPAQNESDSLTQLLGTRAFQKDLYDALGGELPSPADRIHAISLAKPITAPVGSHLLLISASCDRPQICILVVSKTVSMLRAEQVAMEKTNAKAGVNYLTATLQQAQNDYTQAADALRRYIATHPGAKVDPTTSPDTISDPELARLAVSVQQTRGRVTDLQSQIDKDNSIVSASTAVFQADPHIVDQPAVSQGDRLGDRSSLKKAAMAAGVALVLGLGYLFILGWVDTTLRNPRDIEHRFRVPVVTTIPELKPAERF
jgi:capsular polysaccharide biosynthesis protein